jgi:peptide/nickel transport system substrate-binding protein
MAGSVRRGSRLASASVATVVCLALLAAACGSNHASSSSSNAAGHTNVEKPAGPPKPGGQLTVALVGETNSFNPNLGQWSPSSYAVANAIFDPLAALDPKGNPQPYLAKGITSNADFTQWTITLRPGIRFQNGEALNAAAVKKNLDDSRTSVVISQAFSTVTSITTQGDSTVVIKMNQPWSSFPGVLTLQAGYMAAPAMLDDPAGANANPIGTGPFKFVDRQVGASLKTARNPDYWQKDSNGKALPYLDGVEFRVITDASSRSSSLSAGDVDATQVVTPEALISSAELADAGRLQMLTDSNKEVDEGVLAFNNSKPPFDDPLARQAVASAVDQEAVAKLATKGAMPGAWGMFEPGSPYYISKADAGYPKYDPARARQQADEYKRKHGKALEFTELLPADPQIMTNSQVLQAELAKSGIKMTIQPIEQTQLITHVIVTGDYEAATFVIWSSPSPDQGYVFLATKPVMNGLSLNYPRYDDPELRAAMDDFRTTTDLTKRVAAMTRVQKALAKHMQVLFLVHTRTAFAYANKVHGFRATTFPGTDVAAYAPYVITPFYTKAWVG